MTSEPSDTNEVSNILPDAYRDAICRMDLLAIYDLIPEYDHWDETQPNKSSLISRIRTPLAGFRFLGETSLTILQGVCDYEKCMSNKNGMPTGYTLLGNTTNCHMSMIFEFKYHQLVSLFECKSFKTTNENLSYDSCLSHVLDFNDEWRLRLRLDREKQVSYPCSWI